MRTVRWPSKPFIAGLASSSRSSQQARIQRLDQRRLDGVLDDGVAVAANAFDMGITGFVIHILQVPWDIACYLE